MTTFEFASKSPTYGVGFEELENSPRIRFQRGSGVYATRILRCNWSDWQLLARELLGVIALVGGAPVSASPMGFPGMEFLIVNNIDVQPFMPNSPDGNTNIDLVATTSTYQKTGAQLTVEYGPMDTNDDQDRPDIPDGTYLTVNSSYGAEYQTIQGRSLKWTSGGAGVTGKSLDHDINAGIIIPTRQHQFDWSMVVSPPDNTITDAIGKVNNARFYGKAAQTLLFTGQTIERDFQLFEDSGLYKVSYTFSENANGWNKFYCPNTGGFESVATAVGGNPPYATTDYTRLFGYNG